ncbi:MAG: beta-lactamase family protein [Acholeplasmataceae bacterium]|nr:beta-lactamase family protein [Acholeplasmataceae bacterium]
MSKNVEEFNQLFKKHFNKSKNSILSMSISKNDIVKYYEFNKKENSEDLKFGIGSISKTFIGSYIAKLVYENKIKLDDKLDDYFELNKKINYPTILELLSHTSGYSFFIPRIPTLKVMLLNGFNKKNIYEGVNRQWITSYLLHHRPSKCKIYRYSDFNYAVLAILIETIEKRKYKEVMRDYIKNDIGLAHTNYYNLKSSSECPYSWVWEDDNPFLASGGIYSTLTDMTKFLEYQNNLEHSYLAIAHGKHAKINQKNIYSGFSWNSFYSGSFFWHIGGQGYFRSYALFDKKRRITIVILATVDINLQHVNRLGSSMYRNLKRNHKLLLNFFEEFALN